jgi:3-hydroxy-3-methylglutaryl CoA synthase
MIASLFALPTARRLADSSSAARFAARLFSTARVSPSCLSVPAQEEYSPTRFYALCAHPPNGRVSRRVATACSRMFGHIASYRPATSKDCSERLLNTTISSACAAQLIPKTATLTKMNPFIGLISPRRGRQYDGSVHIIFLSTIPTTHTTRTCKHVIVAT